MERTRRLRELAERGRPSSTARSGRRGRPRAAPRRRGSAAPRSVDLDLDHVAVLHRHRRGARVADARRRAGQDQVARLEREDVRGVRDEVAHAEDEVGGVAVLEELAVQALHDAQAAAVAELRHRHERGRRPGRTCRSPCRASTACRRTGGSAPRRRSRSGSRRRTSSASSSRDRAGRGGRSRPRARPRSRRGSPRAGARSPRPGRSARSRTCRRAAARPAARGRSRAMWAA